MLAHAIISTAPTTPPRSQATDRICWRWLGSPSSIGTIAIRAGGADGLAVRANVVASVASSARACSALAPGASRPRPDNQPLFGFFSRSGFCSPEYPARGGRMTACIIIGT